MTTKASICDHGDDDVVNAETDQNNLNRRRLGSGTCGGGNENDSNGTLSVVGDVLRANKNCSSSYFDKKKEKY